MKKIIVIDHNSLLSPRTQHIISTLSQNGYFVKVVIWNREEEIRSKYIDNIEIISINLKIPVNSVKLMFYIPLLYFNILKTTLRESFQVLHVTHLMLLPVAILLKMWKKVKIVYDDYDFYGIMCFENLPAILNPLKKLFECVEGIMVALVDLVLVIDSANDFLLNRHKRFNKNVISLYNFPDLPLDHSNAQQILIKI